MALSFGKFVLTRIGSVIVVVVGVTALTWLSINALRPDLRAGDDRFIFVALGDYLQAAFLHFDFGDSATSPAIATNAAATAVSANSRSKSPVAIPRRMPVKTPGML